MEAGTLFVTAQFIEEAARRVANAARKDAGRLDIGEVLVAVRGLYSHAKWLKDRRAKLLAPAPTVSGTRAANKTNVGDPNAKGMRGVKR